MAQREVMMTDPLAEARNHFTEKKFVYLNGFIVDPLLAVVHRYAVMRAQIGAMDTNDPQAPNTPSAYGDTLMETLLELVWPSIEQVTGLKLFPTYSYFRVYKNGDVLEPHTDREACEISATMLLGYKAPAPWGMGFKQGELETAVEFSPGDAVVYRGMEVVHWRPAFEGEYNAQVFLHFVDRNGPHAGHRFDKRPALGIPLERANQ